MYITEGNAPKKIKLTAISSGKEQVTSRRNMYITEGKAPKKIKLTAISSGNQQVTTR